jgi:uncharacterized protein (DUF433 family)
MNLPGYLTRHEKGEIRLTGHRIDLYDVISRHQEGDSAEMIRDRYPTLDVDLVRDVIAFYRENKADVAPTWRMSGPGSSNSAPSINPARASSGTAN